MKPDDVVLCTRGSGILQLFIIEMIKEGSIAGSIAHLTGYDGFTTIPAFDLEVVHDDAIITIVKQILDVKE